MPQATMNASIDAELIVKIDRLADRQGNTRSNLVEQLLKEALDVREAAQKKGKR